MESLKKFHRKAKAFLHPSYTLQGYYAPVKALWIDLYLGIKKGTRTHLRGIRILLLFCIIAFLILAAALLKFSETPTFCGACHQMNAYMDSWRASTHSRVACTKCHYEPGLINHLKGKWVDGQVSLAYFISGKRPSRPHAEIGDASCLQKGCHKIENLQGNMIYKNVAFSHGEHLGELRRGMRLRCTSCHAQLVQGAHLTVHETNCFICHYYRAGVKREEECISCGADSCASCHFEPKGDIKIKGWSFNHRKYIERGVTCEKCHINVVQGDGHVPEGKCVQCHNEPELLSTRFTSQSMHRNHVTDHKIECADCHTPIRHEIGPILTFVHGPAACDKCHSNEIHLGPRELYRGSGGMGVADSPSLMFTANVDCVACHRRGEESQAALHTTQYAERVFAEACADCHGEGFDNTLKHWKALLSKAENETNQRIFDVQKAIYDFERQGGKAAAFKKAQNLLNEARHNYSFILLGKGVHNIEYAFKLLNAANNKTEQALAAMEKGYRPKEFKTQMSCTTLCHVGMERRVVPFNEKKFSHETHVVGRRINCSECHSSRERHGKTLLRNCAGCHHGKEDRSVKCEDCHLPVRTLIQGKGGLGVKERPSGKLDVTTCVDCHRGVRTGKKESFDEIKKSCIECHDPSYGDTAVRWKTTAGDLLKKIAPKIDRVREEIERIDRRGGHTFVYRKLFGEAEFNYNLAKNGNGVHNLEYTQELLEFADQRLDEALEQLARRRADSSASFR